ncbi:neurocalcin-delta-like [Styela clava]|uniref:neurocalcin-delta-like isoform X1 n=1 Tax=Styela clava TaxID=7725 RepID=UPI001939BCCD|nr:neurocalcin-delta-like isoform X1 [Styela clava]
MGKGESKLQPKELADLANSTNFTEKDIHEWYKGFMKDCPKGKMSKVQFIGMYQEFFPHGDATRFAENIFRTFDENQDGRIDFREFITALSLTSQGTVDEKLGWAFNIYDLDGNGYISMSEMMKIIDAIYNTRPPKERLTSEDIRNRTKSTFEKLDSNHDGRISRKEFISGAKSDSALVQILN